MQKIVKSFKKFFEQHCSYGMHSHYVPMTHRNPTESNNPISIEFGM